MLLLSSLGINWMNRVSQPLVDADDSYFCFNGSVGIITKLCMMQYPIVMCAFNLCCWSVSHCFTINLENNSITTSLE